MTNAADVIADLNRVRDDDKDREMEVRRLVSCYQYATPEDRRVIWAVLNKYAPLVDA